MARIHVLGASGSGTTTLGAALAARLGCRHEDSDAYFWLPTDPPFTTRRARAERLACLRPKLEAASDWVFSGSAVGWAEPLEALYQLVVFLRLDPAVRMARLRQREFVRYGARIAPGGDMEAVSRAFLDWAEAYDTAGWARRSLTVHENWLAERTCPVLRLDSAAPTEDLVAAVVARLTEPA
jgi:adenylate kinase family enzyme